MAKDSSVIQTYFRGESKDYGDTSCVPSIFRKKCYSLIFEQEYYQKLMDDFSEIAVVEKIKRDAEKKEYNYLKILGVLQHYGFSTRLLDISRSERIAKYFASSENFKDDGFVYCFNRDTTREIATPDSTSISRIIKCIKDAVFLQNKSVWEYLNIKKQSEYTVKKKHCS